MSLILFTLLSLCSIGFSCINLPDGFGNTGCYDTVYVGSSGAFKDYYWSRNLKYIDIEKDDNTLEYETQRTFQIVPPVYPSGCSSNSICFSIKGTDTSSNFYVSVYSFSFVGVNFSLNRRLHMDKLDASSETATTLVKLQKAATFEIVNALITDDGYVSIRSVYDYDYYVRHQDSEVKFDEFTKGNTLYAQDATWRILPAADFRQCTMTNFQIGASANTFPTSASIQDLTYINSGVVAQQPSNWLSLSQCVGITKTIEEATHWDVGATFSISASYNGLIASGSAEFSLDASFGGSSSTTTTEEEVSCTTVNPESTLCPGRYTCSRLVAITQIDKSTQPLIITFNCGGNYIKWVGEMKVEGGVSIDIVDNFHPTNCPYYTTDYQNRLGRLPFCDICVSSDICQSCESDFVLFIYDGKTECVAKTVCQVSCGGIINGDDNDLFCQSFDATLQTCQDALNSIHFYDSF